MSNISRKSIKRPPRPNPDAKGGWSGGPVPIEDFTRWYVISTLCILFTIGVSGWMAAGCPLP